MSAKNLADKLWEWTRINKMLEFSDRVDHIEIVAHYRFESATVHIRNERAEARKIGEDPPIVDDFLKIQGCLELFRDRRDQLAKEIKAATGKEPSEL